MQMSFDTCPEELEGWRTFFKERGYGAGDRRAVIRPIESG